MADDKKVVERKKTAFKKFATIRVNKALKQLDLIAALATRVRFDWTAEQATKIVAALREKADAIEKRFAAKEEAPPQGFTL